jgi:hypothetical protein
MGGEGDGSRFAKAEVVWKWWVEVVGGSGGWNWCKLGSVVSSDLRLRPRLRLTSGEPNSVAAQYNRHSRAETCGLQCRTGQQSTVQATNLFKSARSAGSFWLDRRGSVLSHTVLDRDRDRTVLSASRGVLDLEPASHTAPHRHRHAAPLLAITHRHRRFREQVIDKGSLGGLVGLTP